MKKARAPLPSSEGSGNVGKKLGIPHDDPAEHTAMVGSLVNSFPLSMAFGSGKTGATPGGAPVVGELAAGRQMSSGEGMVSPFSDALDGDGPRGFVNPTFDEESGITSALRSLDLGDGDEEEPKLSSIEKKLTKVVDKITETEVSPAQIAMLGTATTNVEEMLNNAQETLEEAQATLTDAFEGATATLTTVITSAPGLAMEALTTNVESVTQDLQQLDVDQLGELAGAATAYASAMQVTRSKKNKLF